MTEKQTLDDWLDAALADTFPASDPIASPPGGQPISKAPDAGKANRRPAQASRTTTARRRRAHD